jgi:virginiamycin B lyase
LTSFSSLTSRARVVARLIAAVSIAGALADCGGGESSSASPGVRPIVMGTVSVRFIVPAASATATGRRRRIQSVASNTKGLSIAVYKSPRVSNPIALATSVVDVSGGPVCAVGGGGRVCTVPIPAPVGSDDVVVTSYDLAPVAGTIPGTAHQLGWGAAAAQTVTAATSNSVSFTMLGVLSSVGVSVALPLVDPSVSLTQPVAIAALDADRNVIIADTYSDAGGNPVTISLSVGGGGTTTTLSTSTLSSPTSNITVTYNAANLTTAQSTTSLSPTITATPSSGSPGSASFTVAQQLSQFPTAGSGPASITVGSDGNLWYPESMTSTIGKMTPAGVAVSYSTLTASAAPVGSSLGADGNVWFAESATNKVGSITPAGVVSECTLPNTSSRPAVTAKGSDGNVWFTDTGINAVGKITTTGCTVTTYTIPTASASPAGITAGGDGRMWFAESAANKIGAIDTGTGTITEYNVGVSAGGTGTMPAQLVAGPDGRMWLTETSGAIAAINTSGTGFAEYPGVAGSGFSGICVGRDNEVWFTERGPQGNRIGEISTSGAYVSFPRLPTASSAPSYIVLGPDGRMWFVEYQNASIGAMQ